MSTSTRHPLSRVLAARPEGPMRSPARLLGWFSIGLGLAEMALPRTLARAAGAPNVSLVTRAYGLREIGVGLGLLTSRDPTPWLWARVAGDALDIATVGAGLLTARRPVRTLASVAVLCGIACIDMKVAENAEPKKLRRTGRAIDYSGRSGFNRPLEQMRGVARLPAARMEQPTETQPL